MPDQDDFDPIGKDWARAYDACVRGEDPVATADELLRAVARMLRKCGGCPSFTDIEAALTAYWLKLSAARALETTVDESVSREFHQALDSTYRDVTDWRIDIIAMRTARVIALELEQGVYSPEHPAELKIHLGAQIVEHLVCHRSLDAARAHAVGLAFQTNKAAYDYHNQVLMLAREQIRKLGRQLSLDPTAQSLRRPRILPPVNTASILFDAERFRLD